MELSPKQQEFVRRVHANETDGFHLALGHTEYPHIRRDFVGTLKCGNDHTFEVTLYRASADAEDFLDELDYRGEWCPDCGNSTVEVVEIEDTIFEVEDRDDLGFSRSPCDCCGSYLGGQRHAAVLMRPGDGSENNIDLDVCEDCLFYIANGDVPEDDNLSWLDNEDLQDFHYDH